MSVPPGQQPPFGDAPSPGYPPTGGQPPAYSPPGGQPPGYPSPGGQPTGYPPTGGQPPAYSPPGGQPPGYPPAGGQPSAYPPAGGQPAGYPPYPPTDGPPYYKPTQAPQKTAGVAIAGLILAFLFFPLGLIFSIIGLVVTGKGGKGGRGLAVAGLVISLLAGAGAIVVIAKVGKNITTIADPGCVRGKRVILDNGDLGGSTDITVVKSKLQTVITGLDEAAADAEHDNVRTAVKTLADDYRQLQTALNSGSEAPADLESRVATDANRIDDLCTIGGGQK